MILVFTFSDEREANKFEYLYKKYKNLLYFKAWEILHDEMAAEDAVSETMIRVYKNMEKIGDPDSPQSVSFLVTIAKNVSLTLAKKKSAAPLLLPENEDEDADEPADTFDLEEEVLAAITEENLCVVIGRLDEEARNIFVMKYAYDLSHKEIAELLGMTENNVTVRLHRTRKRLAEMVSAEGLNAG